MNDKIEQRARELLAAEYESDGLTVLARDTRDGYRQNTRAMRAIANALREQSPARNAHAAGPFVHEMRVYSFKAPPGHTTNASYAKGWNDCRAAMLAAAPKPEAQAAGDRTRFEQWVRRRHGADVGIWHDTGNYQSYFTRAWWECWNEAFSTPASHDAQQPEAAGALAGEGDAHPPGTPRMPVGKFHNALWKSLPAPARHHASMLTQSWAVADSTELKNALEAGVLAIAARSAAPVAAQQPAVVGDGATAWKSIDLLPNSDDLFWFARGDTVDGPRPPQHGGYDADEWDWFAPAEAPPFAAGMAALTPAATPGDQECNRDCDCVGDCKAQKESNGNV